MKNKNLREVCVILVSFRSKKKVKETIKSLNRYISIILVENSMDVSLKKELESKHKNVEVIIPKSNNGQGEAFNLAAKKTNKKFLLFLDMDIKITTLQITKLIKKAIDIKKFGVITPKIKYQNYDKLKLEKNKNQDLYKVWFNTGCVMLIKKSTMKKINYFDKKIFLYYEETDFYKRCINAKLPVYMYDKVLITNPKTYSIDSKFSHDYLKIRNWHYCWSKFYYYKKHYGYFVGLKKTFPNLIKAVKKIITHLFTFKFREISYFCAEILGLLSSYLNINSFYRIKK
jgi:N-acetylglucosaminyl-diphospho-decaprenol L-rhamnosyltransferase